jgi:hypothetical protein
MPSPSRPSIENTKKKPKRATAARATTAQTTHYSKGRERSDPPDVVFADRPRHSVCGDYEVLHRSDIVVAAEQALDLNHYTPVKVVSLRFRSRIDAGGEVRNVDEEDGQRRDQHSGLSGRALRQEQYFVVNLLPAVPGHHHLDAALAISAEDLSD